MNTPFLLKHAVALQPSLTSIRRELHRFPELAFQERETCRRIVCRLRELGMEVRAPVAKTGVVGMLRGGQRGRTIALRADMDALRIQETNRVPYRSANDGVMHACGHDGHMAMVLGAAMVLSGMRNALRGQVKFLFQPAEETVSGARRMIRAGVLKNPDVDRILGIHLQPALPSGSVGLRAGPVLAAAHHFAIRISGRGGHGATPHLTKDPLVAANLIYQAFQSISRTCNPIHPHVLSICSIQGGTSFNVIPDQVRMQGTLRALHAETLETMIRRMRAIVRAIGTACQVGCDIRTIQRTPLVVNAPEVIQHATYAAQQLGMPVVEADAAMVSEDFAWYQQVVPGAFIWLGIGRKASSPLHSSRFDFDERILPAGAALLAACALDFLQAGGAGR